MSSLSHAFSSIGRGDLAQGDLDWMIGPPFVDSFKKLGLTDPEPAIIAYREHYRAKGMFDAAVYDGVPAMLESLQDQGFRLYLATAKPHAYAREITAHFGIAPRMTAEFGPELDGTRNWKGDLLRYALDITGESASTSIMVGDRHHDMAAASEVGMTAVAVSWGYGLPEEWAGAHSIIDHPAMLPDTIADLMK